MLSDRPIARQTRPAAHRPSLDLRDNSRRRYCILSARHFRYPYAAHLRRGMEKGIRPASEKDSKVFESSIACLNRCSLDYAIRKESPVYWSCPSACSARGEAFAKDYTTKIAIMGFGGVGKTQLVLELLFRTKEKHQNCAIIWIRQPTRKVFIKPTLTLRSGLEYKAGMSRMRM